MPPESAIGPLDLRARALRRKVVRAIEAAGRGHLASAFSLIEILRVLYDDVLRYDPGAPDDPARDRLILSKGHGCLALYAVLADKGFFAEDELARFCAPGAMLGGHPDALRVPGVEASTGALGHGPSIGVGMALAARLRGAGHRVLVVTGDGELNEGAVWEAAMCASHHSLDALTLIVDANGQQSYDTTAAVQGLEPLADKWRAFGFAAAEVDGHDVSALRAVFASLPLEPGRPSAVICRTIKGGGVAFTERDLSWHHKNRVTGVEIDALYAALEAA